MLTSEGRDHDPSSEICHRDAGTRPEPILVSIRAHRPEGELRVAVLGAGIAGLVAAHELSKLGAHVTVFEQGSRVGGRIWSYRFPGSTCFAELGAMRIGADHHGVLHYLARMGLGDRLVPFRSLFHNERCRLVGGEVLTPAVAPTGRAAFASLLAKLEYIVRAACPPEIHRIWRLRVKRALPVALARDLGDPRWEERMAGWLCASPVQLLRALVRDGPRMDLSFRLFLRDLAIELGEDLLCLRGGLEQLPERLARTVATSLRLSHEVTSVERGAESVTVGVRSAADGSTRSEVFDYAINTIPPSAMHGRLAAGFSRRKACAVEALRYADASKVAFLCRRRFWESPRYGIDAGASYVGGTAKLVYFPDPRLCAEGSGCAGGALLASYTVGEDAAAAARLGEDELVRVVKREIAAQYPEIAEPGMVLAHKVVHWRHERGFLGGCSVMWPSCYRPADRPRLGALLEDLVAPDGRVYFAGEHCSSYRAWVEGAVVSSLRCVEALLRDHLARGARPLRR